MADKPGYIKDLRFGSSDQYLGDGTVVLVDQVNRTYQHGHWDGEADRKAIALIDEMTGKELREARKRLVHEEARLRDSRQAIRNTISYLDETLRPIPAIDDLDD